MTSESYAVALLAALLVWVVIRCEGVAWIW